MFHNPQAKAIAEKVVMEVDPTAEQIFFEEKGLAIPSIGVVKRRMKLSQYCEMLLTQQSRGKTARNCSTTTTMRKAGT